MTNVPVKVQESRVLQKFAILLLSSCVVILFLYLNHVQPYYFIDEVFHVPQTLQYCAGNFTQWDSKITTLPGLYLLATLILSPLNICTIFYMRCINLLGTFANFYLAYNIIKHIAIIRETKRWDNWKNLMVASNVMLFPPLFFWHFLYYTDVVSVNAVLLMLLLHLRKKFIMAAVIGLSSIIIRQTNIVWVAFVALELFLNLLDPKEHDKSMLSQECNSFVHLRLLWKKVMEEASRGWAAFSKFISEIIIRLLPYATVCVTFLGFIFWNKGIVVGDRTAHVPTIHIPQLFYFSAFVSCFLWPYTIIHWKSYLNFIRAHWIVHSCLLVVFVLIVRFDTLVHPYMLADNRHYLFYFWNKLMGRYELFKYLLIPVYSFTLYAMFHRMGHLKFATRINYIFVVSVVLIPQLLIEPRYFITPYILYRLLLEEPSGWQIIMETVTTLAVNFVQFYIFVSKTFYWNDEIHPQRISW
ncbi:alpha-1,2-glucosyltransferase Alg10 [Nomia melanderi]|uniref:alpha-1,2-glucosyltransferase Alg10 n=1 Tax=Nomia melanderi TaxID=2448451 RepID=UPI001304020B|nr:putative Dol-P-Glc:Glc(2)Man(9)GlcNAc(2)-PP-Dol alpha-1,2-glucosyltransferase [Nomia melanderi]